MLNWYLRYEPFMTVLDEHDAGTILDVGSGWYGITWYAPRRVVQTDLHFDGGAPLGGRIGTADFVCASADRLPFGDDSFDWAISSDMLEHLPMAIRARSVAELTRVARQGVMIGFPSGPSAQRLDRFLARAIRIVRRRPPGWLEEHLQQPAYPTVGDVERALPDGWRIDEVRPNGNAVLQLLVVMAEMIPVLGQRVAASDRVVARRGAPTWFHTRPTMRQLVVVKPTASPPVKRF